MNVQHTPKKAIEFFTPVTANLTEMRQKELVTLLDTLKQQAQSLNASSRKVVIDHTIQICQSFLNNLLEIDWHKHLYEQAQLQNNNLLEQLTLMLELLHCNQLTLPTVKANATETNHDSLDEWQMACQVAEQIEHWIKLPTHTQPENEITKKSMLTNQTDEQPVKQETPHHLVVNELASSTTESLAELDVYFFGKFHIYRNGKLINNLCKNRAKQLLKYLILNRSKAIPKEMLMERFWPNYDPHSARNNLNVAVYCLRQALKSEQSDCVHVLFQDGCYSLNPQLRIRVDTELFEQHIKTAEQLDAQNQKTAAIKEYICAEQLYQGDFLAEDRYEDWSISLREYYKVAYEKLLSKLSDHYYQQALFEECIVINRKITLIELADEHAHRRLMECFIKLNQRHFALKQYHLCKTALAKELGLKPSAETLALYESIKAQHALNQSTAHDKTQHVQVA